ncbi:MAG: hypothetical protein B6230_07960 [Desulfobacteraceae bacterium 4572_89]|nr:MAG: hypothetical protein B6230_07960 [Desulfobacteraceae bacterium 4572_89]
MEQQFPPNQRAGDKSAVSFSLKGSGDAGSMTARLGMFCMVIMVFGLVPFLTSCGGGSGEIPLTSLKRDLADKPTYSILLDDMKKEGTFSKSYYHKYLVVEPDGSKKTDWLRVPEKYFRANEAFLGMALVTKKDGVVEDQVSPPGYGYVGDSEYGRWRQDSSGGSFWEFYGKYAFFSSLFGGWYHPVHRNDYGMYRKYRSQGRPFFGSRKEYGSSGAIAKKIRPGFFATRMAGAKSSKQSFKNRVSSRIGRTKTGLRGRSGGLGK